MRYTDLRPQDRLYYGAAKALWSDVNTYFSARFHHMGYICEPFCLASREIHQSVSRRTQACVLNRARSHRCHLSQRSEIFSLQHRLRHQKRIHPTNRTSFGEHLARWRYLWFVGLLHLDLEFYMILMINCLGSLLISSRNPCCHADQRGNLGTGPGISRSIATFHWFAHWNR